MKSGMKLKFIKELESLSRIMSEDQLETANNFLNILRTSDSFPTKNSFIHCRDFIKRFRYIRQELSRKGMTIEMMKAHHEFNSAVLFNKRQLRLEDGKKVLKPSPESGVILRKSVSTT